MSRRRRRESKHDQKVRLEANRLKRKGWKVKASIPGFNQPKPIGKEKRIIDIAAEKKGATRLIEVETKATAGQDKKQQSTFRRSASQRKRTTRARASALSAR